MLYDFTQTRSLAPGASSLASDASGLVFNAACLAAACLTDYFTTTEATLSTATGAATAVGRVLPHR